MLNLFFDRILSFFSLNFKRKRDNLLILFGVLSIRIHFCCLNRVWRRHELRRNSGVLWNDNAIHCVPSAIACIASHSCLIFIANHKLNFLSLLSVRQTIWTERWLWHQKKISICHRHRVSRTTHKIRSFRKMLTRVEILGAVCSPNTNHSVVLVCIHHQTMVFRQFSCILLQFLAISICLSDLTSEQFSVGRATSCDYNLVAADIKQKHLVQMSKKHFQITRDLTEMDNPVYIEVI